MSVRWMSRSSLWVIAVVSLVGLGCGRAAAPLNTATPLGQDIPRLIQRLDSKVVTERASAIVYLGELGAKGELGEEEEKILAKLREMGQKDESDIVKKRASEAIAKIQGGG
jgi:hypothetical protein